MQARIAYIGPLACRHTKHSCVSRHHLFHVVHCGGWSTFVLRCNSAGQPRTDVIRFLLPTNFPTRQLFEHARKFKLSLSLHPRATPSRYRLFFREGIQAAHHVALRTPHDHGGVPAMEHARQSRVLAESEDVVQPSRNLDRSCRGGAARGRVRGAQMEAVL